MPMHNFVHASRWIILMLLCSFFTLHLHPGGLVNKMTKKIFFMFRRKKSIFTALAENTFLWVWRKIRFCGFCGKYVLQFGKKCVFDEKVSFAGLTKKVFFLRFWREMCIFAFLPEMCIFCLFDGIFSAVLAENVCLLVMAGNVFSDFGGKMCFLVLAGKCGFPVLAEKCIFLVLVGNAFFRFHLHWFMCDFFKWI